jgi:pimeloyl-ACP methyl ester carboxylesterase
MRTLITRPSNRKWWILLFILIALWTTWNWLTTPKGTRKVAYVKAAEDCGAIDRLKYCVYRAQAPTSGDVVYHFHGRNLDERIWNDDTYWTSMVQSEWQRTGATPPVVVTLSYGPVWLLVPKGKTQESGLLDDFIAKLPELDKKTGTPKRRILLGESMGGLNVLIAGLSHPERFAKLASLCPGVYSTSPFDSLSTIKQSLERTGADPKIGFGIWLMAKKYVADDTEWRRISPLSLIQQSHQRYPSMYLSNGLYDAYGNFEGTQQLASEATRRGVPVEWHPLYGGHCAIDASSLARFLESGSL